MSRTVAFNNLLQSTADLVCKRFPEDRDIDYTRSRIELAVSMSPRLAVVSFMENVEPLRDYIVRRDEAFFLGKAKTDDTLKCFNLGDKWKTLSESDKETLWSNVTKMMVLGDKIMRV